VLRYLGFERFAVVGHHRGGRVAYCMTLDSPERVTRLAVLVILPTSEHFGPAAKAPAESTCGMAEYAALAEISHLVPLNVTEPRPYDRPFASWAICSC